MKKILQRQMSLMLALSVAFAVAGCSGGTHQELDKDYMQKAKAEGTVKREIFNRAGGDWDNMSVDDKATFLKYFENDEVRAKNFWELMKHPPGQRGPGGGANPNPGSGPN